MKKFFCVMLVIINLNCFAQSKKWFVSFSAAPTIGGPSASFKKQIVEQGFNQASTFSFFGLGFTTQYPVVSKDLSVLIRAGKRINDRRSIYVVAGQTAAGSVEGFRNQGYSDFILIGSSYGQSVTIDYKAYQFTCGYLYSFPHTRAKIGIGPSLYLFNYSISENEAGKETHTSLVPGASFIARYPLGKEKKLFGVELVFEANMAPPAGVEKDINETGFRPKNASMFCANAGIAFSFRR